jgi:hypothetical protein
LEDYIQKYTPAVKTAATGNEKIVGFVAWTLDDIIDDPDGFPGVEAYGVYNNFNIIPFIYFGDLIDAVIDHAGPTNFDDFRFIFDDLTLPQLNPFDLTKRIPISLANVPISIELYLTFVTGLITNKKAATLSLTAFIKACLNQLIVEALGVQCAENSLQTGDLRAKMVEVTHFRPKYATPGVVMDPTVRTGPAIASHLVHPFNIKTMLNSVNSTIEGIKNLADLDDPLHIRILHVEDPHLFRENSDDIRTNFLRGIPHFSYGQNYGLIKKIQLQKTDQPYLREARFTKLGGNNSLTQLSNVYDATFDMVGNDLCTLGGLIYFDSNSLSPLGTLGSPHDKTSLAYLMGLGGLHIITQISHNMTPGKYSTTIKARFISRGSLKE